MAVHTLLLVVTSPKLLQQYNTVIVMDCILSKNYEKKSILKLHYHSVHEEIFPSAHSIFFLSDAPLLQISPVSV